MRHVAAALLSLLAFAGPAAARDFDPSRPWGDDSPWASRPTDEEAARLTPRGVLAAHRMLTADLRCRVGPEGGMTGCVVDWENITDIGMGKAAVALAVSCRLKGRLPDGEPTAGLFASLTLIFDAGGDPPYGVFCHLSSLGRQMGEPSSHPLDDRARQKSGG